MNDEKLTAQPKDAAPAAPVPVAQDWLKEALRLKRVLLDTWTAENGDGGVAAALADDAFDAHLRLVTPPAPAAAGERPLFDPMLPEQGYVSDAEWARRRKAPAAAALPEAMNPWQRAIDEALIVACLDCTHDGESPERALARLIDWEVHVALDPAVSSEAQALIDRGAQQASYPSAQQAASPTVEPVYRFLKAGDIIQAEDEFYHGDDGVESWMPAGATTGRIYDRYHLPARRRASPSVEMREGISTLKNVNAILYEHEDGRYAVAISPEAAAFAINEPSWHRVGPVEIVGAEANPASPTATAPATRQLDWTPLTEDAHERKQFDMAVKEVHGGNVASACTTVLKMFSIAHPRGSFGALCAIMANEVAKLASPAPAEPKPRFDDDWAPNPNDDQGEPAPAGVGQGAPEASPVAFVDKDQPNSIAWCPGYPDKLADISALYAALAGTPAVAAAEALTPLSEERIIDLAVSKHHNDRRPTGMIAFARAIERAHGIGTPSGQAAPVAGARMVEADSVTARSGGDEERELMERDAARTDEQDWPDMRNRGLLQAAKQALSALKKWRAATNGPVANALLLYEAVSYLEPAIEREEAFRAALSAGEDTKEQQK